MPARKTNAAVTPKPAPLDPRTLTTSPPGRAEVVIGALGGAGAGLGVRLRPDRRRHAEDRAKQREVQATSAKDSAPQRTAKRSK